MEGSAPKRMRPSDPASEAERVSKADNAALNFKRVISDLTDTVLDVDVPGSLSPSASNEILDKMLLHDARTDLATSLAVDLTAVTTWDRVLKLLVFDKNGLCSLAKWDPADLVNFFENLMNAGLREALTRHNSAVKIADPHFWESVTNKLIFEEAALLRWTARDPDTFVRLVEILMDLGMPPDISGEWPGTSNPPLKCGLLAVVATSLMDVDRGVEALLAKGVRLIDQEHGLRDMWEGPVWGVEQHEPLRVTLGRKLGSYMLKDRACFKL